VTPEERIEEIGAIATHLLVALQPWAMLPAEARLAAVRLTVALAAVPLPLPAGVVEPPGEAP